jgi:hypothetical protein
LRPLTDLAQIVDSARAMVNPDSLFLFSPINMSNAVADKPAGNKPIAKKQLGNISVAVFEREVTKADGTTFVAKDYVLQKSYKDKNGEWKDQSISFKAREILAAQEALSAAYVESFGTDDEE